MEKEGDGEFLGLSSGLVTFLLVEERSQKRSIANV